MTEDAANASAEAAQSAFAESGTSAEPSPTPVPAASGEASTDNAANASGEAMTDNTASASGEASNERSERPSGGMPQPASGEWPQKSQSSELWLLLAALIVLAAGLIFARRFGRRRN